MELKNNSDGKLEVENVRPYSPTQQDILKIYEEYAISTGLDNEKDEKVKEDIKKISRVAQPTTTELQRYKLWLEQKYCSPYTGKGHPVREALYRRISD